MGYISHNYPSRITKLQTQYNSTVPSPHIKLSEIKKAENTTMKDVGQLVLYIPGESKNFYKYFGKLFFSITKTFE